MKHKKLITSIITVMLVGSLIAGCSKNDSSDNVSKENIVKAEATELNEENEV